MSRKASRTAALPPVSKEQASAWMRTVLHPLARVARIARQRAGAADYSFRAYMQDFEFLSSRDAAVAPVFELNLRHLRKHHVDLEALIRRYDARLDALREACRNAFRWVVTQPELRAAADAAHGSEADTASFLAEYVVNGLRESPHPYRLRSP